MSTLMRTQAVVITSHCGVSGEIVLRPLYIHHQTFCSERFPDLLVTYKLRSASSLGKSTYVVDFTPSAMGLSFSSVLPRLVAM